MAYRPHKRKRATSLEGKCVEYIGDNLHKVFEPNMLELKFRKQILEYLCETPILVELPDGTARRPRLRVVRVPVVPAALQHSHRTRVPCWVARPCRLASAPNLKVCTLSAGCMGTAFRQTDALSHGN